MTAPSSRVRPALIVAVAVAAMMFLGTVGLVAVAVVGGDTTPSGDGIERQVNVDQPATVPERLTAETSGAAAEADGDEAEGPAAADVGDAPPTSVAASPVTTAPGINEIEAPAPDQLLPTPGGAPVELPVLVTIPPPPSTYPAVRFAELDATDVPELSGWTLASNGDGHLAFERGDQIVDIVRAEASSAGEALTWFYDRVGAGVADLSDSPTVRLGAPSSRFLSVAGSQFFATDTGQQGTSTISGSALAAARADGDAVVIAISRPGPSSAEQRSADGELLRAILAHM